MNRLARFAGFGEHDQGPEEETSTPEEDQTTSAPDFDVEAMRGALIEALRSVYDPEIPVNVYDLGLIYMININVDREVEVAMTLTAPGCPVAGMMPTMIKDAMARVEGVASVQVELVWDPPWSPERMSDEARLQLGLM